MNSGVTSSGSPNQNGSTSGSPNPAFATSRIFEPRSDWTAGRATGIAGDSRTAPGRARKKARRQAGSLRCSPSVVVDATVAVGPQEQRHEDQRPEPNHE